jgi:hypothetical protein
LNKPETQGYAFLLKERKACFEAERVYFEAEKSEAEAQQKCLREYP